MKFWQWFREWRKRCQQRDEDNRWARELATLTWMQQLNWERDGRSFGCCHKNVVFIVVDDTCNGLSLLARTRAGEVRLRPAKSWLRKLLRHLEWQEERAKQSAEDTRALTGREQIRKILG
jgi:hypothetical protein